MESKVEFSEQTKPSQAARLPWNPILAVVYIVVIFFAAQVLAAVLVSLYPAAQHWTQNQSTDWLNNSVVGQFVFVLLAEGLTLSGVYGWLWRYKSAWASIGLLKPRLKDFGYGVLALVPYYALYIVLLSFATKYSHIDTDQQQNVGFNNVHGTMPLILTFVSLVILPPIAEEILMRGLLYTSLRKAMKFMWAALLTSAIFASAHLSEAASGGPLWIAGIDTFTLSLVLCYLREKTGSLWPGITLHGIKNGIAFVALFLVGTH